MTKPCKARIPRQMRSKETKRRLMEAAIKLFTEFGYHKTSSNKIADYAEVPIGSFYAYFTSKKDLFLEIVQKYNDLVTEKIGKNISSFPNDINEKNLYDLIFNLIEAHKIMPGFQREIEVVRLYDADVNKLMKDQKIDITEMIMPILEINKNRIKTENLKAASLIISGAVENIVHEAALSENSTENEQNIRELVKMLINYLNE